MQRQGMIWMPRRFPCASRIYRILGAHGTGIHEEDGVDEMATDYDAPRRTESDEVSEDSLEELKARRNEAQSAVVDIDESPSSCRVPTFPARNSRFEWFRSRQTSSHVRAASWFITAAAWPVMPTDSSCAWTALPDLPSRWSTRQLEGRPRVGTYCFAVTALVSDPAQPADRRDDVCSPTSTAWDPPGRRARSTPLS
jgi:hypothetical protein